MTIKHPFVLAILCAISYTLQGAYSPTMRIHFGASNAIVRVQSGYYTALPNATASETPSSRQQQLNSRLRFQSEALIMVNNHFNYTETMRKTPARFLIARAGMDGADNIGIGSVSFGQGLKCRSFLPVLGQIKGYWGLGAAVYKQPFNTTPQLEQARFGGRLGFNAYNTRKALQSEVLVFSNKVLATFNVHVKLSKLILFNTGIELNRPVAGISLLAGNFRIMAGSRLVGRHVQHGVRITGNF